VLRGEDELVRKLTEEYGEVGKKKKARARAK
jgi:hypothetical protein